MSAHQGIAMRVRAYVVDENDRLHRLSCARYRRIRSGTEPVYLFAGRTVRFVETCMKETSQTQTTMTFACFPLVYFDSAGRSSEEQRTREQRLSERMMQSSEGTEWQALYRAQRDAEFRWRPTAGIMQQLRERVPLPKA